MAVGVVSLVVLVDDHPLLATAFRLQLQAAGHDVELVDPGSRDHLIDDVVAHRADLVVLDLGLPFDGGGLSLVEPLVGAGVRVAILTGESDRSLWARCSAAGAEVILGKDEPLDTLIEAIGRLLHGLPVRPHQRAELAELYRVYRAERERRRAGFEDLSKRERQILAGLVAGRGPNQLAECDFVSVQTIRTQIKSVLRKLDVNSQLEAVARATACGWRADDNDV